MADNLHWPIIPQLGFGVVDPATETSRRTPQFDLVGTARAAVLEVPADRVGVAFDLCVVSWSFSTTVRSTNRFGFESVGPDFGTSAWSPRTRRCFARSEIGLFDTS